MNQGSTFYQNGAKKTQVKFLRILFKHTFQIK